MSPEASAKGDGYSVSAEASGGKPPVAWIEKEPTDIGSFSSVAEKRCGHYKPPAMYYAYILYSQSSRAHYYGMSDDVFARLQAHNAGQSFHTKKGRPWALVWYGAFVSREMAADFEKYLKSGSGQAFLRKRLIDVSFSG